jgi:hypothetical protein
LLGHGAMIAPTNRYLGEGFHRRETRQTEHMTTPRLLIGIAVIALALSACAPGTVAVPPTEPTTAETETASPGPATPAAVIVSLEGLTLVDGDGNPLEQTQFTDPDPVLALLSELLGSTPVPTENPDYGTKVWQWPDIQFGTTGPDYSWVFIQTADLGGLPLQTIDGIHVGSNRDDVLALDPYDSGYDEDGDGQADLLGIEHVTNPDYESLSLPGNPGTDFIEVDLEGDTVTTLRSPSNDYSDV